MPTRSSVAAERRMKQLVRKVFGRAALSRGTGDGRSRERLRAHYLVERELAARFKATASFDDRRAVAAVLYEELYRRVPDHPLRGAENAAARERNVSWEFQQLRHYLASDSVFMDVGAGDGRLAARVAPHVRLAYAVDIVFDEPCAGEPANLHRVRTDGLRIDLPEPGTVDVAMTDQVLEHVHPDDVIAFLRNVHAALRPGGVLVCITPNRLYGPSDISGLFGDVACGLHLREYSVAETSALLREAGFGQVRAWAGARGWYVRFPIAAITLVEAVLERLPVRLRRPIASTAPMRALLGVRVAAVRPLAASPAA